MARIYCGNNLNYSGLVEGTHIIGTNYACLRRGIGVGSHLPYDGSYVQPHAPVDARKFYCGNAVVPPVAGNYFAVGSPSKCLGIGIGIGKAQRAALGPSAYMYFIRYLLPYLLFLFLSGGVFILLYFIKPKFITKKDTKNNTIIDWSKFIPYFLVFYLVVAMFIWWFWRQFVLRWI
jgi:hypothetical protein